MLIIAALTAIGVCGLFVGYAVGLLTSLPSGAQDPLRRSAWIAMLLLLLIAVPIAYYLSEASRGALAGKVFVGTDIAGVLWGYIRGKSI